MYDYNIYLVMYDYLICFLVLFYFSITLSIQLFCFFRMLQPNSLYMAYCIRSLTYSFFKCICLFLCLCCLLHTILSACHDLIHSTYPILLLVLIDIYNWFPKTMSKTALSLSHPVSDGVSF